MISCWSLVSLALAVIVLIVVLIISMVILYAQSPGYDRFGAGNPTPFCSPKTNSCVGCDTDADCPGGVCDNGTCVECTETNVSQCAKDKQICASGHCQMCTVDSKGATVGCTGTQVCNAGFCVNCITDKDCPAPQKCVGTGASAACAACAVDGDCPASGINNVGGPAPGACVAGACVECRDGSNCPASAPNCGDSRCYKCRSDSDCHIPPFKKCVIPFNAPRGNCVRNAPPPPL